jgi:aldehyde:ferredoxin oxidoreductase
MLSAYYEARGWDAETGKPSREKLVELGLEEIANDLWDETH